MNINLSDNENIRVYQGTDWMNTLFINIGRPEGSYKTMSADIYGQNGYVEIREKQGDLRLFQFKQKSYKKELDFGWWEDAKVVFSYNRDGKDGE